MFDNFKKNAVDEYGNPNLGYLLPRIVGLIVGIIIFLILQPFHVVNTGTRGVVTRFGAIQSIQQEGMTILAPWEKINDFSVRSETTTVKAEGGTVEQQPVNVELTVKYNVRPDKVGFVFEHFSKDGDLSSYVDPAVHEVFKSVTAQFTAPELISKRESVSNKVLVALQAKLDKYGAVVNDISMTQFAFDPKYMDAIHQKVVQEQQLQVEQNKLKTTQAQQQAQVITAEATAQAVKAKADGDAYSVKTAATAEADALRIKNQALHESTEVLKLKELEIEKTKAEHWDGVLPCTGGSMCGVTPQQYMNIPAPTLKGKAPATAQ